MGLFAGAAALGMVQQPDRSEIPPTRVIQSILPLTTEQVEVSTPSAAPVSYTHLDVYKRQYLRRAQDGLLRAGAERAIGWIRCDSATPSFHVQP